MVLHKRMSCKEKTQVTTTKVAMAALLFFNIAVVAFLLQAVISPRTEGGKQRNLKPVINENYVKLIKGKNDREQLQMNGARNSTLAIRNWANSEGSERTLLYNDMTYQNGSITVPAAGVYHITSHVKFYVEDNRKDNNSSQTFQHQIVRFSAFSGKQVVLFENVVTECREGINDGAHLEYPSLTGGLAHLDAGDQVVVRVSHFYLLKHDRDWHYFDIYLI